MARARKTEALVVGAGPVGLFTALSLSRLGVGVVIIDEQWRAAAHSYALALHSASLELLAENGLADGLIAKGRRVDRIEFHAGEGNLTQISFPGLDATHPFLLVLPQSEFEGALVEALAERAVKVLWNHSLSHLSAGPEGVSATVDRLSKSSVGYAAATTEWAIDKTIEFEAEFVVGADGHDSTVRRQLEIPFEERGPSELFAVFEFETAGAVEDSVRVVFNEDGTSVLWPLPGNKCRWSFQIDEADRSLTTHDKSRLAVQVGKWSFHHLDREDLVGFLGRRASWFEGTVDDLNWSLAVRFDRRLASCFGRDRAWLAGDAAHITGPVGIHSMNAGLLEGADLASCVEGALRGTGSASCFGAYNDRWHAEWGRLLTTGPKPAPTPEAESWIREHAEKIVPCLPATGAHLDALASGISLTFE